MGGKSKKSKQTVGYKYFMAGIFGLCLKATKLKKIVYGERVAWSGDAVDGAVIPVNAPTLYGGDEVGGSGGLQGTFYFNCGTANQPPNAVMLAYLGGDCPAHRGVVTLSMGPSYVAAFSASFRPLYCLVQNLGYDWYTAKQTIAGTQVNPAHEIRDALISPDLSGQYDAAELDDDSFKAAADTLYAENFGLSPKWTDSGKAQEYIQSLLTHIDGVLVRARSTGKIRLKLLRGGYDVDSLPTIGESQFSEITSLGTVATAAMVNKLTIKYARITDVGEETSTLTGENLANIDMQGGFVNATEIEFKHLTDAIPDLPGRILARELRARSYPLRSFTLKGVHSLSSLEEGDLFVLNAPEVGINSLVCRILEADYGSLDDHQVTLTCSEDIYGVTAASISAPSASEWQDVFTTPTVPAVCALQEMPLALAVQLSPLDTLALWTTDYPLAGFVLSLVKKNNAIDRGYFHKIFNSGAWEKAGDGAFSDSVLLTADAAKTDGAFTVADTTLYSLKAGDFGFIENEIIRIDSWAAHSITVTRGVLDTLPTAHPTGTRLWLPGEDHGGVCTKQYVSGQTASIALAPFNASGEAAVVSSDRINIAMRARSYRPYPPGGLSINGTYLAEEIEGELTVSWKHRDRIDLLDSVVAQTAANIGPEEGTTYTVKVYDNAGESPVLKKMVTGLTTTSWIWDTETADAGALLASLRVELWSVRDGYESLQHWRHDFTRFIPVTNLLLAFMEAGTATYGALTVTIDADGVITLNGSVGGTALNVKYTGGLEINTSRPTSWDAGDAIHSGANALTQSVTILDGTFTTTAADSVNVTTRYSSANIFLNCHAGDGNLTANGTPTNPVRMGVIYLRGGTVLNNLKLAVALEEA